MHDKLQALVAIIALVPVLKFRLSETKRPVAVHLTSRHKKSKEEDIAICECKYDANIREASISTPFKAIKKSCHFCDVTRARRFYTLNYGSGFVVNFGIQNILLVALLCFLFFLIISQPEWRVKWPELVFSQIAFVICEVIENNPQVDDRDMPFIVGVEQVQGS
ncbi:hypothetical protein MTR67_030137 [Solanum verrucosum]|uniref:Uncharacterized protein n=1 Tax=Solanum verrucosum TaxID=315347 RepID=A0AAF0RAH1_SOLVR|nr:hypothetical protein MTR67_030137 [Solanum verrucosum]